MDNSYKKLDAYIMAKDLVKMVYDATKGFPDEESLFFAIKFGEQQFPFPPISRKDYLDLQWKSNAIF